MANYEIRIRADATYDARRPLIGEVLEKCAPHLEEGSMNIHLSFEKVNKKHPIEEQGIWIGGYLDLEKEYANMVISRLSHVLSDTAFKGIVYHAIFRPMVLRIAKRIVEQGLSESVKGLCNGTIDDCLLDAKTDTLATRCDEDAVVQYRVETVVLDAQVAGYIDPSLNKYYKELGKIHSTVARRIRRQIRELTKRQKE